MAADRVAPRGPAGSTCPTRIDAVVAGVRGLDAVRAGDERQRVQVACPAATATDAQPGIGTPSPVKATVPVGSSEPASIEAVKVTGVPAVDGLLDGARVVVDAAKTRCPTDMETVGLSVPAT